MDETRCRARRGAEGQPPSPHGFSAPRRTEGRRQRTEVLNIEQQNKEPQNDEVITSIRLRQILRFKEAAAQMK
jgi:hypothetical protein